MAATSPEFPKEEKRGYLRKSSWANERLSHPAACTPFPTPPSLLPKI